MEKALVDPRTRRHPCKQEQRLITRVSLFLLSIPSRAQKFLPLPFFLPPFVCVSPCIYICSCACNCVQIHARRFSKGKKKRRGQGIPRLGKILRCPATNPPAATTTSSIRLRLVVLPRSVLEFGAPSCSSLNSTSLARFGSIRFGSFQSGFAAASAATGAHRAAQAGPARRIPSRLLDLTRSPTPAPLRCCRSPLTDPGAISTRAAGSLDDSDRSGTKRRKASSPHPGPGGGGGGGSMAGEKAPRAFSIEELPGHLIGEVLTSGGLAAADLARLEATCRALRPLAEYAASKLCDARAAFAAMGPASRWELLERCGGSWKKVLRFLQSVEQSSGTVETSSGSMQVATGRYHTLLVHDSSVYSCGSSLCGVLGHGPDTTQCAAFSRVSFPSLSRVINISASHNHAAFVTESGEVFTCGDNSSLCCGHGEVGRTIFRPMQVEALKGIPCKQVATGLSFTVILTRDGQVYTCGSNTHGQLGHGDTIDRATPKLIELFEGPTQVVQIAAGASYTFAVTDDGTVHSFGSCTNFCLGHGDQHDELLPRAIQSFKRRNIHVVRVSAGDEHAVALDALGYVYTWGRGYCGALGHGDENDKTSPELIGSLKGQVAVQVCARKRKTFVLTDEGSVVAFGWMGFGSLGFPDRGSSDKVMRPRVLESLQDHYVSQISTGLYHTVAVTNKGIVFGFGDNERAQLGQEYIRGCLKPTEIMFQKSMEDIPIAAPSG